MIKLSLNYRPEDDFHGELTLYIELNHFSGKGSAWFNRSTIEDFAEQIKKFPLDAGASPTLEGGIWRNESIEEKHLFLRVQPTESRGMLEVLIIVSDEGKFASTNELISKFLVNYGDLGSLSSLLIQHIQKPEEKILWDIQ